MSERLLLLEPGRVERHYWRDLWHYRELFLILAWRDVVVRYKQTIIGIAWAVLRPLLTMLILTVIFGKLAKLPSDGAVPYALMVYAAMLPWYLFAAAIGDASNSLIVNAPLLTKVYFPRLIMPLATIVTALIDFLASFLLMIGLMAWYRFFPDWRIVFLPLFLALAVLASVGPALWAGALNVQYRDFRYIIPFLVQIGLYVSPVGFSSSIVPDRWRLLYSVNPMVGVIDGFRWSLLRGHSPIYWPGFAVSASVIALFLWLGWRRFRTMERTFADVV